MPEWNEEKAITIRNIATSGSEYVGRKGRDACAAALERIADLEATLEAIKHQPYLAKEIVEALDG